MPTATPRGARRAAPLVLVLAGLCGLTTACSSAHPSATPTTSASAAATATTDARAAQLLAKAETTLAGVRSFRFDATETVAAAKPATTHVSGAVVRGQGVSYTLTSGRTASQVVRIRKATYVRTVPGRWATLKKPRPVADPSGSLDALLKGLADARVASSGATTTVVGVLDSASAKAAGLPPSGQPAQVTVAIDGAGHVTGVSVHTKTQAGTTEVTVTLVTSYTAFDRVPALRAPR